MKMEKNKIETKVKWELTDTPLDVCSLLPPGPERVQNQQSWWYTSIYSWLINRTIEPH